MSEKWLMVKEGDQKKLHWGLIIPGWILAAGLLVALVACIIHYERERTLVNVSVIPSKFDLKYKCRLCGAENTEVWGVNDANIE